MSPALIQEVDDDQAVPQVTLELNDVEETLKRLLLDVAHYIDENPSATDAESQVVLPDELARQNLVLRFAGGWVRDKLLGRQSHDIDVAINKMTGYHFGLRLKQYLEIPGNLEKYGLESIASNDKQNQNAGTSDKSKIVGGLHKIAANPEKSKQLETTTMKIMGLDIDLVNLRKEVYSNDSRNPQIEFGTAEEDAMRRDATVNAMFYNLNTSQVEDLTDKGHEDMHNKFLRTPLEPNQTFKDDPLRILRLIRFAGRLGFTIDPEALSAMRNQEIKSALRRKISRERVGIELEKSLKGPNPHEALLLILDLGLYDTIFSDPAIESSAHYEPDTANWGLIVDTLRDILDGDSVIAKALAHDQEEQFLSWQLACFVPYRDAPQPEASEPGRKPPPHIATKVAREGIKTTSKTSDIVAAAFRNQAEISSHVDKAFEQKRRPDKKIVDEDPTARDVLGMALRRWGLNWRSQVLYSMLVDTANEPESRESVERKYTYFVEQISSLGLLDVCSFKPLIDGKQLAKALDTPPGPWMKDALDVVMAWQLRHPDVENPQEAIEQVKNHQQNGELTSELVRHFLKLTIRPLFIKASPSTITSQGRKVTTTVLPKKTTVESMDDSVNKPWKSPKDSHVLDLLRWVVRSLDHKIVESAWPLVVPPILTLIDDWEAKYKQLGAELLHSLLQTTPPTLLQRTGLGEVFEQALLPCLTYLPTITPESDSIALLSSVYPTLLTLISIQHPPPQSPGEPLSNPQLKSLDLLLRRGVIYGCIHANTHPRILAFLFDQLSLLLDHHLGVHAVKHIKYLLPLLTEALQNPLAGAAPGMLVSATKALGAVVRNCWPRIGEHRAEVMRGVTGGWVRHVYPYFQEDGGVEGGGRENHKEFEELRERLREVVGMLGTVIEGMGGVEGWKGECEMLVGADGRVEGLFEGELGGRKVGVETL